MKRYPNLPRHLTIALILAGLIASPIVVTAISDQSSGDLNGLNGAAGSYDIISVTVPEKLDIIDFEVVKPSPGATETDNSHITVRIDARGSGTLTIRDQNGNILWRGTREETAEGIIDVDLVLPSVGQYTLTLTLENNNLIPPSDIAELSIAYLPLIPEPPITGFITGYLYLSGYAIPNYITYLAIILIVGAILIWRYFRNKANRAPIIVPIPVPAKRAKPRTKKKSK